MIITDRIYPSDGLMEMPLEAIIIDVTKRGHTFIITTVEPTGTLTEPRNVIKLSEGETVPHNVTLVGRCHPDYFYE